MSEDVTISAPSAIQDLKSGMEIKGTVKRIELYGAFVDIGIGQDALLHISQLGRPNVRNVEDVVKVNDEITAYILRVDKEAGRIALSLEKPADVNWSDLNEGDTLKGKVIRIENFGVFVDIGAERPGMVHVSELAEGYVKSPSDVVSIGQEVDVRVLKVKRKNKQIQIDLSMKEPREEVYQIEQEEEQEEVPTAMALAFRRAMEKDTDEEADRVAAEKIAAKHKQEQEDIIARTLRNHSS